MLVLFILCNFKGPGKGLHFSPSASGTEMKFDSMLLTTRQMHMQNVCARVWNKIVALHNVLNSHLSHKKTWQSFSQRRDAHDDTKNMCDMSNHFWDKFTERQKLVPSFSRSSLLLAWRSYTLMKLEYAVALLMMKGNRMVQESSQSHLRFQTYARRKNSLLILIMRMIIMNVQIVFTFFKVRISRRPW